jgi:glycosyltransferase involved in cell wall biosynthesis
MDVSIIVPMYNEEASLPHLHAAIVRAMADSGSEYETIFVDDGSTDSTFEVARALAARDPRLRVVRLRRNAGQTPAMAAGFAQARGERFVTLDADLQNDPADIPMLLKALDDGFDIVCGWREKRHDPLLTRRVPSWVANRIIARVTGVPIRDNGCSLKAYRADLIRRIPLYAEMHRFIPAMAKPAGARVAQIPVRHHPRRFGRSKYGLSRIWKVLLDLLMIRMIASSSARPLAGFGSAAAGAGLLGAVAAAWGARVAWREPEIGILVPMGVSALFLTLSCFLGLCGLLCELVKSRGEVTPAIGVRVPAAQGRPGLPT